MIVTTIPKEYLQDVWPEAEAYIQSAWDQSPGYYNAIDVLDRIVRDLEVLWGVYDNGQNLIGCFTTSVEQYPQSRILVISALAGHDAKSWEGKAFSILTDYAKDHECSSMEARGRRGWIAHAKQYGWKEVATIIKIDL